MSFALRSMGLLGALGESEQVIAPEVSFVDPYGNPVAVPWKADTEYTEGRMAYEDFWRSHVIIAPPGGQGSEDVEAIRLAQSLYDSLPPRARSPGTVIVSDIADLQYQHPDLEVISFLAPYSPAASTAGAAPVMPGAPKTGGDFIGPAHAPAPTIEKSIIDTTPALSTYENPLKTYFPIFSGGDDGGQPPRDAKPQQADADQSRRALLFAASLVALLLS